MAVQVTEGNFPNQTPPTGSIRVLYKNTNGVSNIRALTISNVDLDGSNIRLSLDALEQIRIFLGGQTPLTRTQLEVLSKAAKPVNGGLDYYYIDVEDLFLSNGQQISGSDSSFINIDPYLPQPFFNNDYNALISNADTIRKSNFRYDVDRDGGITYPTNFEAVAGIGELPFTDLKYSNRTLTATSQSAYTYLLSNNNISGSTTNYQALLNDRDLNIRVDRNSIIDALGVNTEKLIDIPSAGETFNYEFTSTLTIEIAADTTFNPNGSRFSSSSLAVQTNKNGYIDTTFTPYERRILSGSFSGNDIYVRLKQTNTIVEVDGIDKDITIKSFLYNSPKLSKNLLPVRAYYDEQNPYADPAPVQDSNYTHTGHTNARYRGSKTSQGDFSGISPAISAKPLEVELYPVTASLDAAVTSSYFTFICSQSLQDRSLEEIYYEGPTEFPEVSSETLGWINQQVTGQGDETWQIQVASGVSPEAGDILQVSTEKVIIYSATPVDLGNQYIYYNLIVGRAYDGTTALINISPGTSVQKISGAKLFTFFKNRPVAVNNKMVWIKENKTVVKTNDRGHVVEISLECPL